MWRSAGGCGRRVRSAGPASFPARIEVRTGPRQRGRQRELLAGLPRRGETPAERIRNGGNDGIRARSEEHTSELQSLMRISYAVFCLKKKNQKKTQHRPNNQ